MSRPAPSHAASAIFTSGDTIHLQLPATKGYTSELTFPLTPDGLAALARVLRDREIAAMHERPSAIATPSMPIQYVVNSWLTSTPDAATKLARAKSQADARRFASKTKQEQLTELSELFDQTYA